ncbi:MAG: alpha/beta hydrolase fold domain-containing protein [Candidatus Riflebacteria bacterium]|nr:alpha/beta hydrolase fold domain-containing protein [Candidatus Riflebacteria bacterium]
MSRSYISLVLLLAMVLLPAFFVAANELPAGPVQSMLGPGGRLYGHGGFTLWESGVAHERYQVFEPAEPVANRAGVVVLLHDWMTTSPEYYLGHIRHLCRSGWVVVFPRYQGSGQFSRFLLTNTVRSLKDFLQQAFARQKIEIDRERFAIIGHGAGAVLAANVAASSDYFGLPVPLALMLVMPHQRDLKLLDLTGISRRTRMLVISGDRVKEEVAQVAREIFYAADRVKTDNKAFVTALSDFYGQPPMIADELAPLTPELPEYERFIVENRYDFINLFREKFHAGSLRTRHIDAFDWNGTFRLFDALAHAVFALDSDLRTFKKSPELRFLGYWSDGRKLKGLIVSDRP